jgi:Domain of unknown function (DUF6457)
MDGWLQEARAKLAEAVGEDAAAYDLTRAEMDELLELARVAAHASGERTNAPLVCYLVGLAHGRHGGELADLVDATVGTSA